MVSVHELAVGEESRWDDYARRVAGATLYTLHGFRRVMTKTYGHDTPYLIATRDGRVCGVLPLFVVRSRLLGRYVCSLPGGPCADDDEAMAALVEAACALTDRVGVDYLELRDGHAPWSTALTPFEGHCTLLLDLPPANDPDALFSGLKSSVRRAVRKSRKSGLSVRVEGAEGLDAFYGPFSTNMRDLGTPVLPRSFVENIVDAFPEQTRIVTVRDGARPVGGMFLVAHRGVVYNPWVSSLREYFDARPNDLLYWEALRWSCAEGFSRFDFGRSQWDSGTFKFKKKWGAEPTPLHYEYYLPKGGPVPDMTVKAETDPLFRLARRTWKRLPLPLTRLLGPPLVKYLNPLA